MEALFPAQVFKTDLSVLRVPWESEALLALPNAYTEHCVEKTSGPSLEQLPALSQSPESHVNLGAQTAHQTQLASILPTDDGNAPAPDTRWDGGSVSGTGFQNGPVGATRTLGVRSFANFVERLYRALR
mgnify:CR=1 FL=1